MEYRRLGTTGMMVSELALGTATFGWHTDDAESAAVLDTFVEAGGNFIDTADIYSHWAEGSYAGRAEEMLGAWLQSSGKRQQLVIATKCRFPMGPHPNDVGLSRRHVMDAVEGSLRRLDSDHIDLYQTHSMDPNTPIDETLRALDDLVRTGKVRYLGCSNYSAWRLLEALWRSDAGNLAAYRCLQPRYNLLQRAEFERDMAELIRSYGLGVIPYSPLAGGTLTGKYRDAARIPPGTRAAEIATMRAYHTAGNLKVVAALERIGATHGKSAGQTALAWLLSNPLITAPIVGARNRDQLAESLGAAGYRLSAEEQGELNQLSDWRSRRHASAD